MLPPTASPNRDRREITPPATSHTRQDFAKLTSELKILKVRTPRRLIYRAQCAEYHHGPQHTSQSRFCDSVSQEKYAAALRTISFMQTPARDPSDAFTRHAEPNTASLTREQSPPSARSTLFKTPPKNNKTVALSATKDYHSPLTGAPINAGKERLMGDYLASAEKVLATFHFAQLSPT